MRDRKEPIKVGLKYCGGCRSGYDRVALVDDIRGRLADKIEFVPVDSGEAEEILIVCGCSTACVQIESVLPRFYITSASGAESWVNEKMAEAVGEGGLHHLRAERVSKREEDRDGD